MAQEKETSRDPTAGPSTGKTTNESSADDVLKALKKEYFRKIRRENYPDTPTITAELDKLETVIKHWKEL